jgi:membrane protein
MKNALNRLWRVHDRSGIGGFVMARVKAVGMILVIGFLLLVSLAVSAGLAALGKYLHGVLPLPESALHILNNLISLGVITVLFAVLFRFLPDAVIRWHDVWIGAALTSALFVVGKFALGVYLGKGAVGSAYGAAGSVLIVLAWVYYSAQIFYFGAAFTAAYAERLGAGIKEAASRAA